MIESAIVVLVLVLLAGLVGSRRGGRLTGDPDFDPPEGWPDE